jgi:ketosteroid isomerase-like protein
MSQENVESFRQAVEDFNRGDMDWVDRVWDAGIVVRTDPIWPGGPFYGIDAARAFITDLVTTLGTAQVVIEELIDAGDRVVARVCVRVHGAQSGAQGDLGYTQILTHRDGKVILVEYFLDHSRALEALGLRE